MWTSNGAVEGSLGVSAGIGVAGIGSSVSLTDSVEQAPIAGMESSVPATDSAEQAPIALSRSSIRDLRGAVSRIPSECGCGGLVDWGGSQLSFGFEGFDAARAWMRAFMRLRDDMVKGVSLAL